MLKINLIVISLILCVHLMSGCVAKDSSVADPKSPYATASKREKQTLVKKFLARGRVLENEGRLTSALEQYKLALTVDPKHPTALQSRNQLLDRLRKKAQFHYERGLAFDKVGKYEAARDEYLRALQNWPDHQGAKSG